jgi:hypothetical protein
MNEEDKVSEAAIALVLAEREACAEMVDECNCYDEVSSNLAKAAKAIRGRVK